MKENNSIIVEEMSKEQTRSNTPITAKEFIPKNKSGLYSRNAVETLAEQYAQAKVLEALEKEFLELGLMAEFYYHDDGLHYYETAVKPKYER